MNVAICLYEFVPIETDINGLLKRTSLFADHFGRVDAHPYIVDHHPFIDLKMTRFDGSAVSFHANMAAVSAMKRKYEIENHFEYDYCVGVNQYGLQRLSTNPRFEVKPNTVYCEVEGKGLEQSINPTIIVADSLTFDRACEYYHYSKDYAISGDTFDPLGHNKQFFSYLRSVGIEVENIS